MIFLNFTIETQESLHIGTGGVGKVVKTVQETIKKNSKPFIPASTLKGVIRGNYQRLYPHFINAYDLEDEEDSKTPFSDKDLFGASNQTSKVFFRDAKLITRDLELFVSPHIKIENKSRVTKGKMLFHLEKIPPGVRFSSTIMLNIPKEKENTIRLFLLSLNELKFSGIGHKRGSVCVKKITTDDDKVDAIVKEMFGE